MDCSKIRRELSARADGERPERSDALEEHVARCPTCAEASRAYGQLREEFRALPREQAPAGLAAVTMTRIDAEEKSREATTPFLRLAASAAAILLIVTSLAIFLTSPGPAPTEADLVTELNPDEALDRMMTEIVRDHAPAVSGVEVNR